MCSVVGVQAAGRDEVRTSGLDVIGRLWGVVMGKAFWKKLLWAEWQPWNNPLGFPFKKELALQLLRVQ